MNARQRKYLERFQRCLDVLSLNGADVPAVLIAEQRRELEAIVARIERYAEEQQVAVAQRLGAARLIELRRQLHDGHLRPIVAVANHLGGFRGAPIRLPQRVLTGLQLRAEAEGIALLVEPVADRLAEYGLGPGFLMRLRAAIAAVTAAEESDRARARHRQGATAGIADAVSKGCRVVSVLDATVTVLAEDNAALKAEWEAAQAAS